MQLSAHAQETSPSPAFRDDEQVIILSHPVPISETESALRVRVYSAEGLQKQGANTPIEGLRQLPSFVGTTATENDSNGGDGSAFINLYALGPNNVLTLINGRRAFGFSNINAIPISALARAEILDHGVYGSDSTAGVVNFILLNGPGEQPYEGSWHRLESEVYPRVQCDDGLVSTLYHGRDFRWELFLGISVDGEF